VGSEKFNSFGGLEFADPLVACVSVTSPCSLNRGTTFLQIRQNIVQCLAYFGGDDLNVP